MSLLCVDVASSPKRLRYLLSESELGSLDIEEVDIADESAVDKLFETWRPTNVIHLAALQIPSCRADPRLGARVNVLGFVNILEAVRRCRIPTPVVYASSIATFDAADAGEVAPENPSGLPATLYGVFKLSNEATRACTGTSTRSPPLGSPLRRVRPRTGSGPDLGADDRHA